MGYASALGLVASGVGMGMQLSAQEQRRRLAQEATNLENVRQAGYIGEAWRAVNDSLAKSGMPAAEESIAKGTERAGRMYKDAESRPVSSSPANRASETVVGDERNHVYAGITNALKAPLHGYDEFTLQQMIKNLRTAQAMQMISQNARASAAVLPFEMARAQSAQSNRAGWGQVLGMVGSGLSLGGGLSGGLGLGGAVARTPVAMWNSAPYGGFGSALTGAVDFVPQYGMIGSAFV